MRRLRAAILVIGFVAACSPARPQVPSDVTPFPTPGPLNKTAQFWDLGLSAKYPDNWTAPQFIDGQMILGPTAAAGREQTPSQPVVAFRIVDPVRDLRLSKSATLEQIAAAVSAGQSVTLSGSGATRIGGLDAAYVNLSDDSAKLSGQTIAFRLPDGRAGVMIGLAPLGVWADFAPTFDNLRGATALLKPADFSSPSTETQSSAFPQGGITFTCPKGWVDQDLGQNSRLYRDSGATEYLDGSGYVNGPQLVMIAESLPKDIPLQAALSRVVRIAPEDKVTELTVGGQPGIQFSYTDRVSGHVVTYIAFASQDKTVMNVLRWTTPGILSEALRPTLDAILQSVKFGAVMATLIPLRPTPAMPATAPSTAPAN